MGGELGEVKNNEGGNFVNPRDIVGFSLVQSVKGKGKYVPLFAPFPTKLSIVHGCGEYISIVS